MITCSCLVQEGQAPDHRKAEIQDALIAFVRQNFNDEAQISWTQIASGNGFTARNPSTSSIVSMAANEPLSPQRRRTLLQELVDFWTHMTGTTTHEIVAVIADPR